MSTLNKIKSGMGDEERAALAAELEDKLDKWVESLPKTKYEDGWPEDRWQIEMEKHPFFMKTAPDLTKGDLPPLIEGLASLKFDPDSNTPEELAANYKEDGNYYYKNKNYRLSVVSYSEGINMNCKDDKTNIALYNNRAQSHYMLENFRSSLQDCQRVLSMDPNHQKSLVRATRCAFKLSKFDTCIKYSEKLLSISKNPIAEKLKNESEKILADNDVKYRQKSEIYEHLRSNGIRVHDPTEDEESQIDLFLSDMPIVEAHAYVSDTREVIWPIILLYPSYQIYDYYQEFSENMPLLYLVHEVLREKPSWDEKYEYKPDNVELFYIGKNINTLHKVDLKKPLIKVMQERYFMLRNLTPTFIVKLKSES